LREVTAKQQTAAEELLGRDVIVASDFELLHVPQLIASQLASATPA
jgi:hypothetical protein